MKDEFWNSTRKPKLKNACDLLNRNELSRTQNRELQRYIDQNKHIIQFGSDFSAEKSYQDSTYQQRPNTLPKARPPKRKEVKFIDQDYPYRQRARSLTPTRGRGTPEMSHYGSLGSLYNKSSDYNRDLLYSPAYSILDRSQDDSVRYETASQGSRQGRIRRDSGGRSKFSGYGDRPGSGVEFMPSEWKGGEILYDPKQIPKSLKPRRLYYSPIGDGVVAADGVEMKKRPKDMSPRITISHIRTVEPGEPGRPGYNLYERHVTQGGSEATPGYDHSSGYSPRSASNLSTGNDFLERLSKQPSERATPDSGRGRTGANSNWSDPDYYQRNMGDGWDTNKGLQDRPDYGRSTRNYDPNNLLDSPNVRPESRYGSAPPPGYTYDSHPVGDRYGGDNYENKNRPLDRYGGNDYPTGDRYGNRYGGDDQGGDRYRTGNQSDDTYGNRYRPDDRYGNNDQVDDRYGSNVRSSDRNANQRDHYGSYGALNSSDLKSSYDRQRCISESSGRFDVTKDYLITNPRELIHHYATTTPVAVLDSNTDNQTNLRNVKKQYVYEVEERYAPYPPYKGSSSTVHPNNFVRQLRDDNLTSSQREANRCRDPMNAKDEQTTRRISEICQKTKREVSPREINYITEKLLCDLRTGHPTPSPL